MKFTSPRALEKHRSSLLARAGKRKREILVCCGPGCLANGALEIAEALREACRKAGADLEVKHSLKTTGCHGLCEKGPLVTFEPDKLFYQKVRKRDVAEIVERTVLGGEIIERLLYRDGDGSRRLETYPEIPFYRDQVRIALRNVGRIDPESLDDYLEKGGYRALARVLTKMAPDEVIDLVTHSGLRGRGGGGFPTGRKWRSCKKAPGDRRFIVCNGDEGDPGAFMDRAIMEGDPHAVLEGMVIGAYAVESREGYIYVRQEYPLAVTNMTRAIEQAREAGFLGEDILGSGFSFDIQVSRGGGAFVCGESSALMRSIEGGVGEPRAKYIHSVARGLYDMPTVLNNVETWTNVPMIVNEGLKAYTAYGTEKSKGTKAFCLVGKVVNTGLIEIPMGTTLREIIYDIGGGIREGRQFKAVQTGGPSGGCVPDSLLDLPVDFEKLTDAGSMMGSGGMIVMDDRTCMVDVARYFVNFLMEESCGKCVPCREGLKQMKIVLERICAGKGEEEDFARIENLSTVLTVGSLCALGKSAANPVLSTLRYFRDEYEAHIREKRCPGGVCKELITYTINDNCNGCGACPKVCAFNAISGKKDARHVIDQKKCTRCGACIAVCQFDAIEVH